MRNAIIAAILSVVPLTASLSLRADPPSMDRPEAKHDFEGKLVMVRMRTTALDGRFTEGFLERVKIRQFGETSFLVGSICVTSTSSARPDDSDVTIWLPLADVAGLEEFKDRDSVAVSFQRSTLLALRLISDTKPTDDARVPSITTSHRRFRIPFVSSELPPERTAKLLLFRSQDEGKTWCQVSEARMTDSTFIVSVENDGPNWFAVQLMGTDGRKWPAIPELLKPVVKVLVKAEVESTPK